MSYLSVTNVWSKFANFRELTGTKFLRYLFFLVTLVIIRNRGHWGVPTFHGRKFLVWCKLAWRLMSHCISTSIDMWSKLATYIQSEPVHTWLKRCPNSWTGCYFCRTTTSTSLSSHTMYTVQVTCSARLSFEMKQDEVTGFSISLTGHPVTCQPSGMSTTLSRTL